MGRTPFLRRSGKDIHRPDGTTHTPRALITPCEAEGCGEFGSFGYKVNFKRGVVGHWYCAKHKHLGEALYHSSTSADDHAAEGEPHEHPTDRKPADGA